MITRYKLFIIRSHLRENLSKKRCKIRDKYLHKPKPIDHETIKTDKNDPLLVPLAR